MNTDPEQLRLLAFVRRTGSLAGAADLLEVTPAAVTQRLAKAERDWGTALVVRGPRGAVLTPAGEALAAYGDDVDRAVVDAHAAFDLLRGRASRRLRIGTFQAAALHLLPPALTALRHRHPDSDLSVVDVASVDAVEVVASGGLDLAVHASYGTPPAAVAGVTTYDLGRDPLVVVLPDDHRLASTEEPLRLRQLRDETWVLIRAGHVAREQLDRAADAAGFTPTVRFETESYDVAQALVGTGIGVALVSRMALTHVAGTTYRPLVRPALHRGIHVSTPCDTSLTPLADAFVALLSEVAADLLD